jgi:hypothetical protein
VAQTTGVLFENVRIFNGTSESLSPASNVLVVGNTIQRISTAPIAIPPGTAVQRIEGEGRNADAGPDRRACPHDDGRHAARHTDDRGPELRGAECGAGRHGDADAWIHLGA